MCFSAPVSFAASAGLGVIGGASLKKAKKKYRYLAAMPLLFGLQQFFEGMQWLTAEPNMFYAYAFLLFAFIIWPTYIPLAIYKAERLKKRKQILTTIISMGAFASLFLMIILYNETLDVSVIGHSIAYSLDVPLYQIYVGVVYYVAVTVGSFFVASDKLLNVFGGLVLFAAFVAWTFFSAAFVSVWCFMSAILSLFIYYFIYKR
ncbi:hypothetical protein HOI83_03685 [Candidatus Uhrbacteria bacterium]|jgi:hypothetical protein|nr:hypothetical protein [Candidatus Uhrbacteria bacterium]